MNLISKCKVYYSLQLVHLTTINIINTLQANIVTSTVMLDTGDNCSVQQNVTQLLLIDLA